MKDSAARVATDASPDTRTVAASSSPELSEREGPERESAVRAIERPRASSPGAPASTRAFAEAVLLTAAFPVAGWLVDRGDPFLLHHPFPWVALAPLLIGLRHGFAAGCTSSLVLGGALVFAWRLHVLGVDSFPAEPVLGLFALAMVTGQFADVWRRDVRRLDAALDATKRRAGELARAHFLLELSHERLHEESSGAPNLHDALAAMARLAAAADGSWATIADRMMAVFAAYAMLEVGVVVRVDRHGKEAGTIAALGRAAPVDPQDPVFLEAVRSKELTYVPAASTAPDAAAGGGLLAAVPLVDTGGDLHAVLCVQSMPFAAFHKKTLETLAVLAGHFADLVARRGASAGVDAAEADDFERALARAIDDRRSFGVSSIVAALSVRRGSPAAGVRDALAAALVRVMDAPVHVRDRAGSSILLLVAPAVDAGYARGMQARLEATVRRELDTTAAEAGAAFAYSEVGPDDTVAGVVGRVAGRVRS